MNEALLRHNLEVLIREAVVIAPTILRFETDKKYGNISDDGLDHDRVLSWELEAKSLLAQLSKSNISAFADLMSEYDREKVDSKKWHSRAIFVSKVQRILKAAVQLLDSPNIAIPSVQVGTTAKGQSGDVGYAFVAMPMDPEDHALVDVLDAIKDAAKRCGIIAERVDEPNSNDRITDRILESIRRAGHVIVDLTNSRPNVFFEAGYAHGFGKIPIYIAKHGTALEFDLKDYPVIFFKNMKELKEKLEKRLKGLTAVDTQRR